MDIFSLLSYTLGKLLETFSHTWYLLVISILISAALKLYVDQEAVGSLLRRNTKNSVLISTGLAVATPFCSCGTTAVILGMIASTVPWAPVIAFMVASPLTSPQELFYSAGLFGWNFAAAFFAASILLGLLGGAVASMAENRGWLRNQARMAASRPPAQPATMVSPPAQLVLPLVTQPAGEMAMSCCGSTSIALPVLPAPAAKIARPPVTPSMFMTEVWGNSKRLLPLFFGFTFIGYLLNALIPVAWITSLFGADHAYSVPLAATLGLPFYINTEASLPLVRAMLDGGMSQGAALAFLITGAGTSVGAIGGALTIARWRVVTMVIGTLWAGSILMGFAYNLFIL